MNPLSSSLTSAGLPVLDPAAIQEHTGAGWWTDETLSGLVRRHAAERPDAAAYLADGQVMTWAQYDALANTIAGQLAKLGLPRGARVGVLMPDGCTIHAVLVGCARAGVVAMGIGARSGDAEIAHLLTRSGAQVLLTQAVHRGRAVADLTQDLAGRGTELASVIVVGSDGIEEVLSVGPARPYGWDDTPPDASVDGSPDASLGEFGAFEVSMLNSTSGTTGLPKCVCQFDARWLHFARLAIEAGRLDQSDVVLSAVPTPYGFGLWTSHYLGPVLGAPTVVFERFDAAELANLIETHRVTVLAAVTTQFRMLLGAPNIDDADLSSLKVMFTGGEAIPVERARAFEARTGAALLQFFGSNESGAFSWTTLEDPQERRFSTGGRVSAHMHVRLFDDSGQEVSGRGIPGGRGPLTCAGYFQDEAANQQLFTADGWMLMGDLVTIDDEGYLTLVGRTSDIIIRGGKNISAAEVENHLETHPDIALVSVVPVPDDTFGERVCAVATVHPGRTLTLDSVVAYLSAQGVSREWFPERLVVVEELPRNAGGKIAKGQVKILAEAAVAD